MQAIKRYFAARISDKLHSMEQAGVFPTKARKPENRVIYRGHGYVLFAYAIRNPVTQEYEWPHCVAKEGGQVGVEVGLSARNYYHTLESAKRDLEGRPENSLDLTMMR